MVMSATWMYSMPCIHLYYFIVTNKPNVAGYVYGFMCMYYVISILVAIIQESINYAIKIYALDILNVYLAQKMCNAATRISLQRWYLTSGTYNPIRFEMQSNLFTDVREVSLEGLIQSVFHTGCLFHQMSAAQMTHHS